MNKSIRVECNLCEKRYFIPDEALPFDIKEGEAFPHSCPFCEEGTYAILPEKE